MKNKTISDKAIESLLDRAIYQMAEEENIELGVALKKISENELREITGKAPRRAVSWRGWWWQAASIAAVVAIAVVCVLSVQFDSRETIAQLRRDFNSEIDNTIVAYNYVPAYSKDGCETPDISTMTDSELRKYIPTLQKAYEQAPADDIQECEDAGMRLAMAYLKLHRRDDAISLLNKLKTRFDFDEDFVAQCNKIIGQLEWKE